eukprot:1755982-Prymnesium_polylepis.2
MPHETAVPQAGFYCTLATVEPVPWCALAIMPPRMSAWCHSFLCVRAVHSPSGYFCPSASSSPTPCTPLLN